MQIAFFVIAAILSLIFLPHLVLFGIGAGACYAVGHSHGKNRSLNQSIRRHLHS